MQKLKKIILILVLACSAETCTAGDNTVVVDSRIKHYVREWCWAMEQAGIPWESRFRELKSILVEPYSVDSRETGNHWRSANKITINARFLGRNPCAVRATVFHELGHACFGLEHDCCAIMLTRTLVDEEKYCDRWNLYLREYLVQCKKAANE